MSVIVTYPVLVCEKNTESEATRRDRIHRELNFLKISLAVRVSFNRCGSAEGFLAMHSSSLKVVYCLAILLREMNSRFKAGCRHLATSDDAPETENRDIDTLIYGLIPTVHFTCRKKLKEKIKNLFRIIRQTQY